MEEEELGKGLGKSSYASNKLPNGRKIFIGFGVQDYPEASGWTKLNNPIKDIGAIAELLREEYSFETTCYTTKDKTTGEGIISIINDIKVDIDDSVILYFSGHGQKIERAKAKSYFAPSDGVAHKERTMIAETDLIDDYISQINCAHVTVFLDYCYAKGDTPNQTDNSHVEDEGENGEDFLKKLFSKKSRCIISSGYDEVVSDGRRGGHSPFAAALLDCLEKYEDLRLFSLFNYMEGRVFNESNQMINIDTFKDHGKGQFVFFSNKERPNKEKLKAAFYDLNFNDQVGKFRQPTYIQLIYMHGTKLCGQYLLAQRYFHDEDIKIERSNLESNKMKLGHHEAINPDKGSFWEFIRTASGTKINTPEGVVNSIWNSINKRNIVYFFDIDIDIPDIEKQLIDFFNKLNNLVADRKFVKPSHNNSFMIFLIDRRGVDGKIDMKNVNEKVESTSDYTDIINFESINPVDKNKDIITNWWIKAKKKIHAKLFIDLTFDNLESKEYVEEAVRKISESCQSVDCYRDIFFEKKWIQ